MKRFDEEAKCSACGFVGADTQYVREITCTDAQTGRVSVTMPAYLRRTCRRCNYTWLEEPLNAEPQPKPISAQTERYTVGDGKGQWYTHFAEGEVSALIADADCWRRFIQLRWPAKVMRKSEGDEWWGEPQVETVRAFTTPEAALDYALGGPVQETAE